MISLAPRWKWTGQKAQRDFRSSSQRRVKRLKLIRVCRPVAADGVRGDLLLRREKCIHIQRPSAAVFHLIAGLSINRCQAGRKRVGTSVYVSIAYDGSGLIWTSFDGLEHDRLVEVIRPAAAPTTTNGEGWPRREKRKKRKKATKARGSHEREKATLLLYPRDTSRGAWSRFSEKEHNSRYRGNRNCCY